MYNRLAMANISLTGSLRILFLYDVCEEIRTEQLRTLLAGEGRGVITERRRDPAFHHPSPDYVRFERPPVVQQLGSVTLKNAACFDCEINYYEYGAVSVKLAQPFAVDWPELVKLSSQWIADPQIEQGALQIVRGCLAAARPALLRPNEEWLVEDYYDPDNSFLNRVLDLQRIIVATSRNQRVFAQTISGKLSPYTAPRIGRS